MEAPHEIWLQSAKKVFENIDLHTYIHYITTDEKIKKKFWFAVDHLIPNPKMILVIFEKKTLLLFTCVNNFALK